jgi:hypothetical protein
VGSGRFWRGLGYWRGIAEDVKKEKDENKMSLQNFKTKPVIKKNPSTLPGPTESIFLTLQNLRERPLPPHLRAEM